jgi:hypothetical protein
MPEQTLPRVEPGHESPLLKLPTVENGAQVKDNVTPSDYPKHVTHPWGGTVIAKDAEHEATILASIAALPAKPAEPVFTFGDECATLLGRDLTADERTFCNSVETAAHKAYEAGVATAVPPDDQEPDEVIQIPAPTVETKQYADGSSATGIAPLPDVSPEGAPVVTASTPAAE